MLPVCYGFHFLASVGIYSYLQAELVLKVAGLALFSKKVAFHTDAWVKSISGSTKAQGRRHLE